MPGDQSFKRLGTEGQGLMLVHTSTWDSMSTVQRSRRAGEKRTPEAQGKEPRSRRDCAAISKTIGKRNKAEQGATRLGKPKVDCHLSTAV